jgi:hypothetical protein
MRSFRFLPSIVRFRGERPMPGRARKVKGSQQLPYLPYLRQAEKHGQAKKEQEEEGRRREVGANDGKEGTLEPCQ